MKKCIKCKKDKSIPHYYKHKHMSDGHLNKCKECCKEAATSNRNKDIEKARKYDRDRANDPKRVKARKEYAKTEAYKISTAKGCSKYRDKNSIKVKAHRMVMTAIKSGRLTRKPCEVCGTDNNIQAHHEDYYKPIEVMWLCVKHHAELHVNKRKEERLRGK